MRTDVFLICAGCGREKPATFGWATCEDCGEALPPLGEGDFRVVRHDVGARELVLRRESVRRRKSA